MNKIGKIVRELKKNFKNIKVNVSENCVSIFDVGQETPQQIIDKNR
jgi:hypothetical protein